MKIYLVVIMLACGLMTGCSLIPKSVEFGQKKVKEFPSHPASQLEKQRQAVALAAEKAREAEKIAEADKSEASKPAGESAVLSEAVGRSIGPPSAPWSGESGVLAQRLDSLTAKYNRLLEKFADRNDEYAGKKIEGTGFLQIPYFVYVGLVIGVVWLVWIILRAVTTAAAAANPGVAVGMKVAQVGGRALSRGFSQLIKGGEQFKDRLKKEVNDPELQKKLLEIFQASHRTNQDADVQELVKNLTK